MKTPAIILGCLVALLVCVCAIVIASFGLISLVESPDAFDFEINSSVPTATPVALNIATPDAATEAPTDSTTLQILENAIAPENNPADLAARIGGVTQPIPATIDTPPPNYAIGDSETFWATNTDTAGNFQVSATLQYITPNLYFWIEDGVTFDADELAALAEDFQQNTYPTVRQFFGSEWSPGIDSDPHLYILLARGIGDNIAGYFSSADEMNPLAHEYSNAREMFFLNADNIDLNSPFTYGVLSHEFQHMVHWNGDRNETTWMNEGFSELAALLTGYYEGGFDLTYARNPDIQLNTWPEDAPTTPHYGGSFLFLAYFLDRYGNDLTQQLVAHPQNGFPSIDMVLENAGDSDPLRARTPNGDDLFQDFAIALYLQDPAVADGRFAYQIYSDVPTVGETEIVETCPSGPQARDVAQYGIDYIRITCAGEYTLRFTGSTSVSIVPIDPYSGDYAFWSNRGDESDMTLTRQFDFTGREGSLTLEYQLWTDIEVDYDYAYLLASLDGETWQILQTPRSTDSDPSGNSYGWAYNGDTNGWVQESIDISQFAGQQVWLRFEYITDAAVNGDGLLLDDIAIPEIGYASDFEEDDGGWVADGFVRIQNVLPQTYRLSLITFADGGTQVEYIDLSPANTTEITITIGGEVDEVVLVVSGTTRFTRQRTGYQYELIR